MPTWLARTIAVLLLTICGLSDAITGSVEPLTGEMPNLSTEAKKLPNDPAAYRSHFLGWQCRLRQDAVRRGGRPTSGMCPLVTVPGDDRALGSITVLIVKRDSEHITSEFRHMVRRTHDPADRYAAGLKILAASYYQRPLEFADDMTALFNKDAIIASRLLVVGHCVLTFEQHSQRYLLPCAVRQLAQHDPLFQATYWHNSLFNAHMPGAIEVLAFQPGWAEAHADPPIAPA